MMNRSFSPSPSRFLSSRWSLFFLFLLLFSLLISPVQPKAEDIPPASQMDIYYFYNNPCESCNDFGEFVEQFQKMAAGVAEKPDYQLHEKNGFHDDNKAFRTICQALEIPFEEQNQPMVVIGNQYLSGSAQIDSRLAEFFLEAIALFDQENPLSPEIFLQQEEADSPDQVLAPPKELQEVPASHSTVLFFHTSACGDCRKVRDFLGTIPIQNTVNGQNSFFNLQSYNISEPQALEWVQHLFQVYQVPQEERKVPIVFYQEGYLSGYQAISEHFTEELQAGKALGFQWQKSSAAAPSLTWSDLPTAFFTGLLNGFNPCSISMLFFFMSLLLAKNANVLKLGFTYIAAKTLTYFLIGTVLYSAVSLADTALYSGLSFLLNIVLIVLMLVFAFLNFLDFLAARREQYDKIRMQLPTKLRDYNQKLIARFTDSKFLLAGVFGLGVFISLGEFLCTGQIYLATILYFLQKSSNFSPIVACSFLLYVLAMALPLLILTILIHKGKRVLLLSEGVRKKMPLIKLANAGLFLLFAVLMAVFTLQH